MDTKKTSPLDLLSDLSNKYSRGAERERSEAEVLKDALSLVPHCRFFYCELAISKYLELLYKLSRNAEDLCRIVEEIERHIDLSVIDQYLPYLDLLLVLQIKLRIYDMLSDTTKAHINTMIQSNPLEIVAQVKRDRDNNLILREEYLDMIDYLICLSFEVSTNKVSTEVLALFDKVRNYLAQMIYLGNPNQTEYRIFYIKKMTNLIRCISLFLEKGELYSDEFFRPDQIQSILGRISTHFDNEEVSVAWLELLYQIAKQHPSNVFLIYFPDSLLDTVHEGSDWIKDIFLRVVRKSQMKIFKHYLSKLTELHLQNNDFISKVFLEGIRKFNGQTDDQIKKLLSRYDILLKCDICELLPEYSFEMMIILYKRYLITEVDQNVQTFNNRLKTELESMNVKRLRRAGDYISLLTPGPESKELSMKWIQRMIQPEMLDEQDEYLYSLYTIILVLGYSPLNPEDQESLEIAETEIQILKDQLYNMICGYTSLNQHTRTYRIQPVYDIVYNADRKLALGFTTNDHNFEDSKMLLNDFNNLLREFVTKLQQVPILDLNMTKTDLDNIDEGTFCIKFNELVVGLDINRSNPILEYMSSQMPSTQDTRALFNPQTVFYFLKSTILWDGLIKIFKYAFKYYNITHLRRRGTILANILNWSSNLTSITNCSYFRYLNLSQIHDTTKAYIIHQIFLTSVNKIKSFTLMSSSIIKFIYIEPTKAMEFDPSLKYVIDDDFLKSIAKICGTKLDENIIRQLPDRIFYGALNSATDGRTLYGGYIILNQKYRDDDDLAKCSAKLTLIHELAHLISRLEDDKYKYLIVSPKKQVKIEAAGERLPTVESDSEAGNYLETQLFGFRVKFINPSTMNFLNDGMSWSNELDIFEEEFRRCVNKKKEEKIPLQRYTLLEREVNGSECVYRTRMHFSKASAPVPESNQ